MPMLIAIAAIAAIAATGLLMIDTIGPATANTDPSEDVQRFITEVWENARD